MAVRYFNGVLEGADSADLTAWRRGLDLTALVAEVRNLIGTFQYNVALQRIWHEVLAATSRYIQETQPFKLFKTDPDATRVILLNLAEALRVTAILLKPFLPRTAATFYRAFDFEATRPWGAVGLDDVLRSTPPPSWRVTAELVAGKPAPLFPKIEAKEPV